MAFAETTSVPVEKSKAEIERLLAKYGASRFMAGWDPDRAVIGFEMRGRGIRMSLPLPKRDDPAFKKGRYGWDTAPDSTQQKRFEQEQRRRWRALLLVIKAKLEAVESGIVTFDDEWLAHFVMPGGRTVGEMIQRQLTAAYESGTVPRLLIGYSGEDE